MKTNIHPDVKESTVTCACGSTFKTKSVKEEIAIEVCNECHPFYTGAQGRNKKTGNVEKFNRKYNINQEEK